MLGLNGMQNRLCVKNPHVICEGTPNNIGFPQYPRPSTEMRSLPFVHHRRNALQTSLVITLAIFWISHSEGAEFMFRTRVDGQMIEGKPLYWTDTQMFLLGRDGALYQFDPQKALDSKKTSPHFFGYATRFMKQSLQEEFGDHFELTTTRHYIVVHPSGQKPLWAHRFEELYRSFQHSFRVRGFLTQEPPYPLVAIVFRNQAEYYRHATTQSTPLQPGYLGHYDPQSNRVYLFDSSTTDQRDWSENARTIIHEATHQAAYNVGIHTRFTTTPRWLSEGLATLFESSGPWDSNPDRSQKSRLNQRRFNDFRHHVRPKWEEGSLRLLVASDSAFQHDATGAYATAWALSFYLCETQPRQYCQYLEKSADRPMFSAYPAADRVADFELFFGDKWKMLEAKVLRYLNQLENQVRLGTRRTTQKSAV